MRTILSILILLPLSASASPAQSGHPSDSQPHVVAIDLNNPTLSDLEIETEEGESITLKEYLQLIATPGGEVPWPTDGDEKKKEESKD